MDYLSLKHFHMSCAGLSGALFLLRGVWMMRASTMLRALPGYIVLGSFALKRGRTKGQRQAAFAAALALALFAYIVSVAVTKRPFPFY